MSVPIWKPRLAAWFAAHHGVVTHAQFLAMGASPATVADLCRRGEITRIAAGVYCSAHYPVGDEQRMVATCSHTTTSMTMSFVVLPSIGAGAAVAGDGSAFRLTIGVAPRDSMSFSNRPVSDEHL